MIKKAKAFVGICYVVLIWVMVVGTICEWRYGHEEAVGCIYSAWWFVALWSVLALGGTVVIVGKSRKMGRSSVLLHVSLLVILAGAGLSFATSRDGFIHLRKNCPTRICYQVNGQEFQLPMSLRLYRFEVEYYADSNIPSDYCSYIDYREGEVTVGTDTIAMNRIGKFKGYRFYQYSFDEDKNGTLLAVRYDPWGTPVSYAGYALLALSAVFLLIEKRGHFRNLLHRYRLGVLGLFLAWPLWGYAEDGSIADSLGRRQIVYNGRVAPYNTMARDFLQKVSGKSSYKGMSAEEVVDDWIRYPNQWKEEKIIRISDPSSRKALGIDGEWASLSDFFDSKGHLKFNAVNQDVGEKLEWIRQLTSGEFFSEPASQMKKRKEWSISLEIFYNTYCQLKIFAWNHIFLGIVFFLWVVFKGVSKRKTWAVIRIYYLLSFFLLLTSYCLRGYLSGRIPLANGYETMLCLSVCMMCILAVFYRKDILLLCLGIMATGFTMLAAGMMDHRITSLPPILNSPLLYIHVAVIMLSYALLLLTCIIALGYFIMERIEEKAKTAEKWILLNRILLYPALCLLAAGIFLGAIWANISWGKYWSWDPKEVWALITLMVYAMPFHYRTHFDSHPRQLQLFFLLAFIMVLATFFGVNWLLGGMHSYA